MQLCLKEDHLNILLLVLDYLRLVSLGLGVLVSVVLITPLIQACDIYLRLGYVNFFPFAGCGCEVGVILLVLQV